MTTPALDLTPIQARADAASAGPWFWIVRDHVFVVQDAGSDLGSFANSGDALFAAKAREDIPALLAEVHRLRAQLAAALPLATAEQHAAALQAGPDVAVDVVEMLRVAGLWETSSHPEGDAGRRTVAGGWCIVEWHGAVREWRFRGCGLPPSGWYPTREAAMAAADAALLSAGWALAGEASRG